MPEPMNRFVLISGCSGGGKSTLLSELRRRGYAVVEEPGRRIIAEELESCGGALAWVNLEAFAKRAIQMALNDRSDAEALSGLVFFDRGLIDAAAALEHASGRSILPSHAGERYNRTVFMAPPWPQIYTTDEERKHGFEEAVAEYDRLLAAFDVLGYRTCELPKVDVAERADFVLGRLSPTGANVERR